jgi:hypothetical protein
MIGWGALSSLAAAGALLVSSGIGPPHAPGPAFADWMFRHSVPLGATQLACGILTITCGLGVRSREPWSRRAGQVVMSLWAVADVALAIAMATMVGAPAGSRALVGAFFVLWRGTALAAGLMWSIAAGVPVWLLERRDVRDWFEGR